MNSLEFPFFSYTDPIEDPMQIDYYMKLVLYIINILFLTEMVFKKVSRNYKL